MNNSEITNCKRCLYNSNIPKISFTKDGFCNYCVQYDEMDAQYKIDAEGKKVIDAYVAKMKLDGKGKITKAEMPMAKGIFRKARRPWQRPGMRIILATG